MGRRAVLLCNKCGRGAGLLALKRGYKRARGGNRLCGLFLRSHAFLFVTTTKGVLLIFLLIPLL